jgi:aminoglycoside 6'-N-acetyltransferase
MMGGERVRLRAVRDGDWALIEEWGQSREALWGPYQRFQLDHVPRLREAYHKTGLLSRDTGLLLIEAIDDPRVVGFVRYTLLPFPDAGVPHPEIGFGIADGRARGKDYAHEGVQLLIDYLFSGYQTERISAFTDAENGPARRLLEKHGFRLEGTLRSATFRDGPMVRSARLRSAAARVAAPGAMRGTSAKRRWGMGDGRWEVVGLVGTRRAGRPLTRANRGPRRYCDGLQEQTRGLSSRA